MGEDERRRALSGHCCRTVASRRMGDSLAIRFYIVIAYGANIASVHYCDRGSNVGFENCEFPSVGSWHKSRSRRRTPIQSERKCLVVLELWAKNAGRGAKLSSLLSRSLVLQASRARRPLKRRES